MPFSIKIIPLNLFEILKLSTLNFVFLKLFQFFKCTKVVQLMVFLNNIFVNYFGRKHNFSTCHYFKFSLLIKYYFIYCFLNLKSINVNY
jgi:hypothetical protein